MTIIRGDLGFQSHPFKDMDGDTIHINKGEAVKILVGKSRKIRFVKFVNFSARVATIRPAGRMGNLDYVFHEDITVVE